MDDQTILDLVLATLAKAFPVRSVGADVEVNGLGGYDQRCRADVSRVCIEFDFAVTVTPQEMARAFSVSPLDSTAGWCITTVDATGIYVVHP